MRAKPSPTQPKAVPPKASKASAYQTIGRTSDGIYVLKPKAATSSPTDLGKKVARLMAEGQSLTSATGRVRVHTKSSQKVRDTGRK